MFVLGNGSNPEQHEALLAEQSASHDLLHVLCKENCMNTGKTFLMYERFYQMVRSLCCSSCRVPLRDVDRASPGY